MKLTEIQQLIKFVAKSGVTEVELETTDFKINIKTPGKGARSTTSVEVEHIPVQAAAIQQVAAQPQVIAAAPVASAVAESASTAAPSTPEEKEDAKYETIKSPMIGTFYRSASPEKPAFVNIGDDVRSGQVICIIEAMKLFNEIEAEISGKIVKVLVDDATPVEYDQPLFLVEPA